ncbi:thioesterase family protein [Candidatus Pelagibacter sp.]|nr:thioesterase family protein [Candidatus Pelagibacter sp.]
MLLKSFSIKQEWVDYNDHMNMAYYVLIFDQALEVALEKFNMGESAAKDLNRSTMVVETNTKYLSEVKQGDEIDINMTYFDHDKKRLHIKMEMIEKNKKKISATIEWISLYIDLSRRKVTEFEEDKLKLMDKFIKDNKIKFSSNDLLFSSKLKK